MAHSFQTPAKKKTLNPHMQHGSSLDIMRLILFKQFSDGKGGIWCPQTSCFPVTSGTERQKSDIGCWIHVIQTMSTLIARVFVWLLLPEGRPAQRRCTAQRRQDASTASYCLLAVCSCNNRCPSKTDNWRCFDRKRLHQQHYNRQ